MTIHKGSKCLSKGIKRTALSLALGMCVAGGVQAQTNTAGAVAGQATVGDTITVNNPATGFSRTITVSGDGSYRFSALPTGSYTVTRTGTDGTNATRNVTVQIGSAATASFASAGSSATTLDTVTVTGSGFINPIDVSSVDSTTILTAEQIAKVPVPRDITSVALLAPGTVRGDAAFGNLASFGGSSVAENQYFVNGFNITNTFKNLQFGQIPFEAIAEQQVKTGGYGAEFGRSTGGVINLITKSGTNEFHAGGNVFWTPESLTETRPNLYDGDGNQMGDNSKDNGWEAVASVWASGALIKDKLFAYALLQYKVAENDLYPGSADGYSPDDNNTADRAESPNWLVKLDWNISDNHLLGLTAFSDATETETDYYTTTVGTVASPSWKPNRDAYLGTDYQESGGEGYSLKYTGYLTDTFTLSALAGYGEFSRSNYNMNAEGVRGSYNGDLTSDVSGCPIITDARPSANTGVNPRIVGCTLANFLGVEGAKDTREQFRIDAEWQLANHRLRGGVDIDNFESVDGESYSGGASWRYGAYSTGSGVPSREDIVRLRDFRNGAVVNVDQRAFYVEDNWQVTDNFLAYVGLRWDTFENINGDGQTFVKIENQFAPRLGFSWDVNGDSTFKLYGNAGRYALPLTSNVAVRGASASLYAESYYTYTGVDPATGAPTGLTQITNPNNGEMVRYLNNEFGIGKDPASIASTNLEPMYQDEYILGFQAQMTDNLSVGVRGIYRDLKRAIDDQCDYRPIFEWAEDNGYELNPYNPGFAFCHIYNPGADQTFNVDVDGDGTLEQITLAADVLGPDAKRTYSALEFFWEGSWDRFFMQGSYTYAKSKGNTEGGVKSDIGQDGTGVTQDFDYPELAIGSFGYLPNDRRHTLKLFGNYEFNDQWSVGANLLVQSGRPINCFGFLGGSNTSHYANSYFSCDLDVDVGLPGDGAGNNGTTIVNRGTAGRTEWSNTLDLNVTYRPGFADGKLAFKVDVFNVLNNDAVTTVDEFGEDASGNPRAGGIDGKGDAKPNLYKTPITWQEPRAVRFMVQYDF